MGEDQLAITLPLDLVRQVLGVAHRAVVDNPKAVHAEDIKAVRQVREEVDQVLAAAKRSDPYVGPRGLLKRRRS